MNQSAAPHPPPPMLAAYARGDLTPADARLVEKHVAVCGDCRASLTDGYDRSDDKAKESLAPPSVEMPETAEVRAIPSQVSVMHVPHTLEGGGVPSRTSITTGIGPRRGTAGGRPRGRRLGRWLAAGMVLGLGAAVLLAVVLFGVAPRVIAAQLTRQAETELAPLLQRSRLAELQHPALTGDEVFRPGGDAALGQALTSAAADLTRAVDASADRADARRLLALTHLLRGQVREARAHYLEVEAIVGPAPETQLGLGILDYLAAGVANDDADREYALEQADDHFRQLSVGDAGYAEALYNRAAVSAARGDREQARQLLDAYRVIQPDSPWVAELAARIDTSAAEEGS